MFKMSEVEDSALLLAIVGLVFAVLKLLLVTCYTIWFRLMLRKWKNAPNKDIVIVHTAKPGFHVPSISPFSLKLQTYLRLADIKYEIDTKNKVGPMQMSPWITHRGENLSDTDLIIQFLNKEHGVNLNANLSQEQIGTGRGIRLMLEKHFIWAIDSFRLVEFAVNGIPNVMKTSFPMKYLRPLLGDDSYLETKRKMSEDGIGKHSGQVRYQMLKDDLIAVSKALGKKSYIFGDEPSEDDCAVFGFLAQVVYAMSGSEYEKLVQEELDNLISYCERMKQKLWPDWEKCIDQGRRSEDLGSQHV